MRCKGLLQEQTALCQAAWHRDRIVHIYLVLWCRHGDGWQGKRRTKRGEREQENLMRKRGRNFNEKESNRNNEKESKTIK